MISFSVYLLLFTVLLYSTGFFGLFKDDLISGKYWSFLFLGKALAVPVFYLTYSKFYGGIEKFDTGKFYNDVVVLSDFARTDFGFFLKLLFGLQDDTPGSPEYFKAVQHTYNWDNGTLKDFLYNDNRVLIRIHLLLNFLTFGSYLTHALFNCFLSFVGILFLYKNFKEWFAGKELLFLLILCFFPSLWFYTGALLKEGPTLLVLGVSLYSAKQMITGKFTLKNSVILSLCVCLSCLLKPYVLVFGLLCFSLFFICLTFVKSKYRLVLFLFAVLILGIGFNFMSLHVKGRSLSEAALQHHRRFVGMTKGGIFLSGNGKYLRLKNDTSQIIKVSSQKDKYKIREQVSYMYWKGSNRLDTFYCKTNLDTLSVYSLVYIIPESQSNVDIPLDSPMNTIFGTLYYTLYYPDFFQAKNSLQRLASLENILVLFSLLLTIIGLLKPSKDKFLPLVFLFFALSLCVLIGITAPNSGAIFRYRSPALIFILLSALYSTDGLKTKSDSRQTSTPS